MKRIALVTGANRGLGYEISRQLGAAKFTVIAAARDAAKSEDAAKRLREAGVDARPLTLDVRDAKSVAAARERVERETGRVDVLVNNAGVFIDKDKKGIEIDEATVLSTFDTNALGALRVAQAFAPLMVKQGYGRIVNLSSGLGTLTDMGGGFPSYRISKTALNAITRLLASELEGKNVLVNSMCPGWCRTDMGGPNADRSPEQGAETAVFLATLPDGGPTGKYFRDRREIAW